MSVSVSDFLTAIGHRGYYCSGNTTVAENVTSGLRSLFTTTELFFTVSYKQSPAWDIFLPEARRKEFSLWPLQPAGLE